MNGLCRVTIKLPASTTVAISILLFSGAPCFALDPSNVPDGGFWSALLVALTPTAVSLAVWVKAFLLGSAAAFVMVCANRYSARDNADFSFGLVDGLLYVPLGGLSAVLGQIIHGGAELVVVQSITIGVLWPQFIRRIPNKDELDEFFKQRKSVPVKKKKEVG